LAEFIQVMTTVDSKSAAKNIASEIVQQRLAACVQISQCQSVYRWQGKLEDASEYLCVMKSRADLFPELEQTVKQIHPYEVPEIVASGILTGNKEYLDWLDHELRSPESM